jgi:AraC-like DNA-binding protein
MAVPQILIAAIIIVFVIAFVITMLFVNSQTSKIIDANVKLAEIQNTLLSQNKTQTVLLEKLEEQTASQQRTLTDKQKVLDDQQRELDELYKRLEEQQDKVTELRQQTRGYRQLIKATQDMNDEELMAWLDERMDETRLYTTPTLSLKEMAKALGLTQKRLGQLFKNQEKFNNLGEYLTEKRFLLACELMRENPEWTIEAVAKEAGFLTRRTFQEVVKSHFGLTPTQFRQTLNSNSTANASLHQDSPHGPAVESDDADGGDFQRQVGQARLGSEKQ